MRIRGRSSCRSLRSCRSHSAVFRTGNTPDPSRIDYQPVSPFPVTETYLHPDFPALAFGHLGAALSLLGRGSAEGRWGLLPGSPASPRDGVLPRCEWPGRLTGLHRVRFACIVAAGGERSH